MRSEARKSQCGSDYIAFRWRGRDGAARACDVVRRQAEDEIGAQLRHQIERASAGGTRARKDPSSDIVEDAPFAVFVVNGDLRVVSSNKRAKVLFSDLPALVSCELEEVAQTLWSGSAAAEAIDRFRVTLATGAPYAGSGIEARSGGRGGVTSYGWHIQRVRLTDGTFGIACWVLHPSPAPRARESTTRLRETEARLQLSLEASQMGTFVFHLREDRSEPDERMLALFGLSQSGDRSLASALLTMIHPEDGPRYAAAVRRSTDPTGPGTVREDVRVVHPDGSLHWIAITGRMVFEGRPRTGVRLVGMASDITERKLVEERLREREERLQESDRRKNEFLAMLSHELRNPLAPIRTALELIRVGGATPAAMERVHETMDRQMGHMVRLIDDLLDVSRITSGKVRLQKQPCPLTELVDTAIETNRAALDASRISLRVDIPDEPVLLDVDPTRLVQILSNLLHNAIKFTPAGGDVRISAEVVLPTCREPFNDAIAEKTLCLTVMDSGIGISPEMLPRVFEMFTQGEAQDGSRAGLGIGLALARRFVEMHGGSIDAESAGIGRGSTFTIRLPLSARVEPPSEKKEGGRAEKIRRRIVVVDDNVDSADIMAMYVSTLGGEAKVAYSGEKGLAHVIDSRPDAVLLDIGMPGMDGYETCRRIREELGSEVLVVAMTGWGQEQDKQRAREAGFDAHLTKPVNMTMLRRVLADPVKT